MNVTAIAKREATANKIEQVLIRGDLSKLTQEESNDYYLQVCESAGLNPLTQPFEYLTLNGKRVLYAKRNATDQLRTIHNVSVTDMTESERDGVFIVTVKVSNGDGRTDMAKGAVNIASLRGEALANAMMKAETKAKRRATLSICGLGLLDETEVETLPNIAPPAPAPAPVAIAKPAPAPVTFVDPDTGEIGPRTLIVPKLADGKYDWAKFARLFLDGVETAAMQGEVDEWWSVNESALNLMLGGATKLHTSVVKLSAKHRAALVPADQLEEEIPF